MPRWLLRKISMAFEKANILLLTTKRICGIVTYSNEQITKYRLQKYRCVKKIVAVEREV